MYVLGKYILGNLGRTTTNTETKRLARAKVGIKAAATALNEDGPLGDFPPSSVPLLAARIDWKSIFLQTLERLDIGALLKLRHNRVVWVLQREYRKT